MARISYVEPRTASPEVQQIYEHRLRGRPASVHKAMAHNPQALVPFLAFYAAAGRSFDRRLWELVYLRVSFINRCAYCAEHHIASSKKFGLGPADWKAVKGGDLIRFTKPEQVALRYAEKLTRTPAEITDVDVESLKPHFSDQQIVDLHLLVGLANLTNRFTSPLGLELEFPPEPI
ncbi:MAG: carboxymuconolactone decarboxylase family protein [Terriglobales bacterium]